MTVKHAISTHGTVCMPFADTLRCTAPTFLQKKEAVATLTACCYRAFSRISVSCILINVTGLPLVLEAFIAPLMMPCSSVLFIAPVAAT
jgi:hypothetical protein